MRRFSIRLGVALLTFFLGAGSTWTYLRTSQALMAGPESSSVADAVSVPIAPSSPVSPIEAVKITPARSYRDGNGVLQAEFDVFNGGGETLYYQGYGEGNNMFWSVRRGRRSQRFAPFCGTGLAERELAPGESVRFEAVIGREAGVMQVGYEFYTGRQRLRQTIWSGDFYVPTP